MNKRLLVLLLLALVVWGGVKFFKRDQTAPPESDPNWPLFSINEVRDLNSSAAVGGFHLIKRDAGWSVTRAGKSEAAYRADQEKVEAFLNFINGNKPRRRLEGRSAQIDREFGLDNPAAILTIKSKTDWTLKLGVVHPMGDTIYAVCSSEPDNHLLLDVKYDEQLSLKEDHFYDLRLMDLKPENISKIRLERSGKGGWEITRTDKGFDFTWPESLANKEAAVSEVEMHLHDLVSMKAAAFAPDNSTIPAEANMTLSIWPKEAKAPLKISVYKPSPEKDLFLTRSSWQTALVELDQKRVDKLCIPSFSLRERRFISVDLGEVVRLQLRQNEHDGKPAHEMAALKTESGWKEEGSGRELKGMDMLLWRLTDLRFESEPSDILPETGIEILDWELFGKDEKPKTVFKFFFDPGLPKDQCWLKVEGREKYYPVLDQFLEDLQGQLAPGGVNATEALPPKTD